MHGNTVVDQFMIFTCVILFNQHLFIIVGVFFPLYENNLDKTSL